MATFTATITAIAVFTVVVVDIAVFSGPGLRQVLIVGLANTFALTVPISLFVATKMLQNWRLTEQLQHSLHTDRLTGLTSRDAFFDLVDRHNGLPGIVMMIDIDRFKDVNDRYGHLSGDQVLQAVAGLLTAQFPKPSIVGRFGGDEFVVFLPALNAHEGVDQAEAVRAAVAKAPFDLDDQVASVCVSVGMSYMREGQPFREALQRADGALYDAKRGGRNQVAQR